MPEKKWYVPNVAWTKVWQRCMVATAIAVLVGCFGAWFATRQSLPARIRIATGQDNGLYHDFGAALATPLTSRTGRVVDVQTTAGSKSNSQLLDRGDVDLALVQAGFLDPQRLSIVAPLYPEALHLIVRKESGIANVGDLEGRRVALGPEGSGMRAVRSDSCVTGESIRTS